MIYEQEASVLENSFVEKELGDFNNIDFNKIEDWHSTSKKILWGKKRVLSFFILFLGASVTIASLIYSPSSWILGILIMLFYFGSHNIKAQKEFLINLAKENNLKFLNEIPVDSLKGNLFKVFSNRRAKNALIGNHQGKDARFFYYSYVVKSVRSSSTYDFTVFEIFFAGLDFPHTLLSHKKKWVGIDVRYGKKDKNEIKVTLEEEFDEEYNLYIKDGYGIEAMQVFNKDFLSFLVKEKGNFNIELNEDRLYIYATYKITRKEELEELFNTANETVRRLSPLINRMENDVAVLNKYYK
jgi:hypothetical protein